MNIFNEFIFFQCDCLCFSQSTLNQGNTTSNSSSEFSNQSQDRFNSLSDLFMQDSLVHSSYSTGHGTSKVSSRASNNPVLSSILSSVTHFDKIEEMRWAMHVRFFSNKLSFACKNMLIMFCFY